jgi:hypothetical protein
MGRKSIDFQAKRCRICKKVIRHYNKSGLCGCCRERKIGKEYIKMFL